MLFSSTFTHGNTGPPWAGNQLTNYVNELVTACEDRAQEVGFDGMTASLPPKDDPNIPYEAIFDDLLQATVAGVRASIRQALQGTWGRDQCERLATGNPDLMTFGGDVNEDPTFSAAPTTTTTGQHIAWSKFKQILTTHYTSRLMPYLQRGLPGF